MAFTTDAEKPRKYPIARILGLFGWIALFSAAGCIMLAFSGYKWVEQRENMGLYLLIGSFGCVLLSGVFIGQAKALDELARIHARLNSRLTMAQLSSGNMATTIEKPKPRTNTTAPVKERIIHISEDEAKRTGVR